MRDDAIARPAGLCRALLRALEASEGRRRRRKRDQTPDAIGLHARRRLLERVVRDDPRPEAFEAWLLAYVEGGDERAAASIAATLLEEWRLAHAMPEFAAWLERGAPSEDA
jgi:hypothetical protein